MTWLGVVWRVRNGTWLKGGMELNGWYEGESGVRVRVV